MGIRVDFFMGAVEHCNRLCRDVVESLHPWRFLRDIWE